MRAIAIVHQPDAGPGVFAEELRDRGIELDEWELSTRGKAPKREIAEYDAVLTFGGAMHPDQEDRYPWVQFEKDFLAAMIDDGMPILAVCLGSQLLIDSAGGTTRRAGEPEIGWLDVEVTPEGARDPVIGSLAPRFEAFEWHSYEAIPPEGAEVLANTPVCPQAYRLAEAQYGIQFHAEVTAADLDGWLDDYDKDEDAVAIGLNPEALRAESVERIEAWNRLGRELCGRFFDLL